jgi:hypothetical protein
MPNTHTLSEVSFGGGGTSGCAPSASCSAGGLASYSYAGGFAPDILLSGSVGEAVYSVVVGGLALRCMSPQLFCVKFRKSIEASEADIVMRHTLSSLTETARWPGMCERCVARVSKHTKAYILVGVLKRGLKKMRCLCSTHSDTRRSRIHRT